MSIEFLLDSIAALLHRGVDHLAAYLFGAGTTLLVWLTWMRPVARRQRRTLQASAEELTGLTDELRRQLGEKSAELQRAQEIIDGLSDEVERHSDACQALGRDLIARNGELYQLQEARREFSHQNRELALQLTASQSQLNEYVEQIETLANFDGKLWQNPPGAVIPPFRPLNRSAAPIIAVVNLKGGVGKTTITANLGAALFNQGWRVLLADLDYQASLSYLCLPPSRHDDIRAAGRFVHRLLESPTCSGETVLQTAERIGETNGFLLSADESLMTVETQAMAQWLTKMSPDDVRYRLRRALHDSVVQERFDVILLDCPPRLTTACVNALACADYVLIPVLPDHVSAEAVPRLLRWLHHLKYESGICPNLSVLGIVGNKAYRRDGFSRKQQDVWDALERKCLDTWKEPVHRFATMIPDTVQFADASRTRSFAALSGSVRTTFLDFLDELRTRMPLHESRRSPVVS